MAHEKEIDMTDEERASLEEEGTGPSPNDDSTPETDDELEALLNPGGDPTPDAAEAARLADEQRKADEAAAAAAANAGKQDEQPPPMLVANAPEDADAQLAKIAEDKKALTAKFDDGEMTAADFQLQLDTLNRGERTIELQVHEAQIAQKMQAQQARNSFLHEVKTFTDGTIYKDSPTAWGLLDASVKQVAADPASANLSAKQILEKAHELVLKDPVMASAFAQSKAAKGGDKGADKKPAANIPPNLGRMPAADQNDAGADRFSALDRLFARDPIAYEDAMGRLTPADREAYLARP